MHFLRARMCARFTIFQRFRRMGIVFDVVFRM